MIFLVEFSILWIRWTLVVCDCAISDPLTFHTHSKHLLFHLTIIICSINGAIFCFVFSCCFFVSRIVTIFFCCSKFSHLPCVLSFLFFSCSYITTYTCNQNTESHHTELDIRKEKKLCFIVYVRAYSWRVYYVICV